MRQPKIKYLDMKTYLWLTLLVFSFSAYSQVQKPIKWESSLSKDNPEVGEEITITFKATIDKDWYLYSSDFDPDLGPKITEFTFQPSDSYELVGGIVPVNPKEKYDDIWEGNIRYFKGEGTFLQKVKVLNKNFKISGNYEYQVCSDVSGLCIPFDDEFEFVSPNTEKEGLKKKENDPIDKQSNDPYSLLSFMLAAFLFGLSALLTPCVFPMIPMTVSFFTGRSKSRSESIFKSGFYGFSIILIYVIIGSVIAPFMGPETANELATGWLPNIIFFSVFVIFALSFFGLFEITLPHSWVNQADRMGDKGGLVGIFFMALTLTLVSFSCTGPIVGSILVESAGGQFVKPILGMLAFGSAFALPFTLFALFPHWVNSLPKSGGWLNSVKVVLGFLELAFAFKFLSIADQAYHWHLLDREVYLAIWIVIFSLLGFYLLGKIQLPGDSGDVKVSVPKLILSIITFSFVVYLIPGMFGAPLKGLAGYLPPVSSLDFNMATSGQDKRAPLCEEPLYADFLHWPHGLNGYFDYEQALACARSVDKPIFVDFTGHGCVNCREMEQRVWSDPKVLKLLQEEFVLLALYVDDKKELPKGQWYTSTYDGKVKKSIGKQNADFQITKFENNAQPYYIILDGEEKSYGAPKAYDSNVDNFVAFLQNGLEEYRQSN